jgi:hypothetical protein
MGMGTGAGMEMGTGTGMGMEAGSGMGFGPGMGMMPGTGMGSGPGMGFGPGICPASGMGSCMGTGMWPGQGVSPGAGWMYPMMNPYNYIMRVSPAVDRGVREAERTSVKHAMTEVALISFLMGMGYDYSTAHRLVESWEINEMFLKE